MSGEFNPVEFLNQESLSIRTLLGLKKDKLVELAQECDLADINDSTKKILVNGIADYLDLEGKEKRLKD